jgi:hypothetical protein
VDSARTGSRSEQELDYYLAYWGNKDSNQASSISITSSKTNKRIKTLYLYESGSKKHTGHVGGLAVSKKYLWVASGKNVYKIPLSTISSKKDYSNIVMTPYALGHKASYATYSDGILWIGGHAADDASDVREYCDAG